MLYSIKLRQNINMHGLLETAGYINTSYADPWWAESIRLIIFIWNSHITANSISFPILCRFENVRYISNEGRSIALSKN